MLAKRIIPTMLCRGRTLVKGRGFDAWRPVGHVAQAAKVYSMRAVDELVLLDITATREGRGPDLAMVEELGKWFFTPLAVGGGIRGLQDAADLLRAGADKVVVRTAGTKAIAEIACSIGSQAVIAALDVTSLDHDTAPPFPALMGAAIERALEFEEAGAGEIMVTRCERDGTMMGYDLTLIAAVSDAVGIPVIASGGCGTYEHMHEALQAGADAVAAGAMFQFTDATPRGAAEYLRDRGVEVRI